MTDRSSCPAREDRRVRPDAGRPIEAPNEHQGVRDSLARCFSVESLPEDIRGLLSRL